MGPVEKALTDLGITLPDPPGAMANYVPVRTSGDLAFVSGQIPMEGGQLAAEGPVPSRVSPEAAQHAARVCVLNALAALKGELGSLTRIKGIVRVGVFVASDPGFDGQAGVANGASDLLVAIFGDAGRHARAAVGSVALPLGASVEVELIVEIDGEPTSG